MRLISCVPSLSELVHYLDPEALVGRTRYCVFPEEIESVPVIGGTKKIDLDFVRSLVPDLIIAAKEENDKNQVEELSQNLKVLVFDIKNFSDALDCIAKLGQILNCEEKATTLLTEIKNAQQQFLPKNRKTACYLIWKKPWMTVGADTFIHSMMNEAGLTNVFGNQNRYPEIESMEVVKQIGPDYLLLSSEPYPFSEKNREELQRELPKTKVILVDGTFFSWYGSRLKEAFPYFCKMVENQGLETLEENFNPT